MVHMFQRLKQRWKVNGLQLFLILCVFAITGTTTAYLTRQVTYWLNLDSSSAWYWILKIGMLLFGYQVLILLFSIPFGQFSFFWNYEKKILGKMGLRFSSSHDEKNNSTKPDTRMDNTGYEFPAGNNKIRLAIFASGAGSNARRIIEHFRDHPTISVAVVACNKPGAGVIDIAKEHYIPVLMIEKEKFFRGNAYVDELKDKGVDFIVLAGFLWKVPGSLLRAWPQRIINIHPALLPNYGGKGMYGSAVHSAVVAAKEKESGITIHYIDDIYDHGQVIFQATCPVTPDDTAESLAQKIHQLEHLYYPTVIEKVIRERVG